MKKALIPVACVAFALSACSEGKLFKHLGVSDEGMLQLDPESIREVDGKRMASMSMVSFGPKTPKNQRLSSAGEPTVDSYGSALVIDCEHRKAYEVNRVYHLSNNQDFRIPDSEPKLITPNSPMEKAMDFVCLPGWRRSLSNFSDNL